MSEGFRELRIQVLGPVCAWLDDRPLNLGPARQRALLALLAFRVGRPVSRDEIIDALWGDHPPASAANGVHTYVKGLRQALEPDRPHRSASETLASVASGYALQVDPGRLDALVFELRISQASRHHADADLAAARSLETALALWQGVPLLGIPGPWAETERIRLTELRLKAVEELGDLMIAAGRHAESAVELARLVREYPLREPFRAQLMTALYRCGRQAEALAVFAEARRVLVSELGVEPGPDLQRLHQQVLRADPEITRPRPLPSAQPLPRQLPGPARGFTGRATELAKLSGLLDPGAIGGGTVVISAIGGMAGIGKTALALQWAHQVADRFPDGQLYVNLRGFDQHGAPLEPSQALRGFLDAFAVPAARIPASLAAQSALYRSLMADKRILLVIDNARDEQQVRPLLPGGPACLVVVTSRSLLAGLVASEGAQPLALDLLETSEAHELLARRLSVRRLAAEPEATAELVIFCGRLPLALSVAAARLATNPGLSIAAVVSELADARRRLDALATDDPMTSVRAVFSWSYQSVSPEAARMFRLLGIHPGPDISAAAAASLAGLTPAQARATLAELAHLHLIMEQRPGRFTFHDLMRAYAAESAAVTDDRPTADAAVQRVLDHYAHTASCACLLMNPRRDAITMPEPQAGVTLEHIAAEADALTWFTAEHQILLRALALAADSGCDTQAWQIAWSIADFLGRQGHWQDWTATQRIALASAERLGDLAGQAHARRGLGEAFIQLGSMAEAGPHLQKAAELYARLDDDGGQAGTYLALAYMLEQQGRPEDALAHARKSLDMYRDLGHQPGQARALNNVGWCLALAGDFEQALGYCQQALVLHHKLGNRFGAAATLDSLGYAHHQFGDFARAITCYQRAVDLYGELGERYQAADALAHLGDTCHAAEDELSARQAWKSALATLDDLGHPSADTLRLKLTAP